LTSIATASSSAESGSFRRDARAIVRLLSLGIWLGSGTVVTAIGVFLLLPFPGLRRRWRRGMFRLLSSGTAGIMGARVLVEGQLPPAPYLLVANHLSYLDVITISSVLPARFVAKREVKGWPLIGVLSRLLGTIFIHREQKRDALRVNDQLARALSVDDGALIFPESTSSDGAGILPFRPALLEWAAQRSFPVHTVSVSYDVPAGEPPVAQSVCWYGDMPFGSHFYGILRLSRVHTTLRFTAEPIVDSDRKRLAERLREAIAATYTPTYTPGR
jgi:1-acyl-sn-glycerol-3-phosphate acyltransferase